MTEKKFTKPKGRRFNTVDRINLSQHVLNIKLNKCSRKKFNFNEIEDFVRAIADGRQYQYDAIKDVMTYLWGGGYQNVTELAKENFAANEHLREKFGNEELIEATIAKDPIKTQEEALIEIYKKLRPGELPTVEAARSLFDGLFYDNRR